VSSSLTCRYTLHAVPPMGTLVNTVFSMRLDKSPSQRPEGVVRLKFHPRMLAYVEMLGRTSGLGGSRC